MHLLLINIMYSTERDGKQGNVSNKWEWLPIYIFWDQFLLIKICEQFSEKYKQFYKNKFMAYKQQARN